MHSFDSYGWLSSSPIAGRETDIEPPAHGDKIVGEPYPNWTGFEWVMVPYSEPVITPVVPDYGSKVTRLAFRNRFTPSEKTALYTAAETVVSIRIYLDDLAAATWVDLARPDTVASVNSLVPAILTAERANEILTAPVQPVEIPE